MALDYNELILGDKTDAFLRRLAINLAIIGFLVHLFACVLYRFEYLDLSDTNDFFDSYLDSLYTPFSIILAYEVYELIRAIPDSFSNSIGKQFEVISLLVVRDIFKNLAEIDDSNVNAVDSDVVFIAVEALAFTILFATALYFRKMTILLVIQAEETSLFRDSSNKSKHLHAPLHWYTSLLPVTHFQRGHSVSLMGTMT